MKKSGIFYMLPVLFLYTMFLFVPAILTLMQYFTGTGSFNALISQLTLDDITKTFYVCALSAFFQISFSVLCLILILRFRENIVISEIFLVFSFIPSVAWSIVFMVFLEGNFGTFSLIKEITGVNIAEVFTNNQVLAYSMVAFLASVQWIGFHSLMYFMIIRNAPKEIFYMARMDGLTWPKIVQHLFIPHIYPFLGIISVATILTSLKVFEISYVLNKFYNSHTQNAFTNWFDLIIFGKTGPANSIAILVTGILACILGALYVFVKVFLGINKSIMKTQTRY